MKHRAGVTLPPRTTHTELHTGKRNLKTQDVKLNVRNKKDRNTEQELQNTEHRTQNTFSLCTRHSLSSQEGGISAGKTKDKTQSKKYGTQKMFSLHSSLSDIPLTKRKEKIDKNNSTEKVQNTKEHVWMLCSFPQHVFELTPNIIQSKNYDGKFGLLGSSADLIAF